MSKPALTTSEHLEQHSHRSQSRFRKLSEFGGLGMAEKKRYLLYLQ